MKKVMKRVIIQMPMTLLLMMMAVPSQTSVKNGNLFLLTRKCSLQKVIGGLIIIEFHSIF